MWGKFVPQNPWQIVHKQLIAEVIFSLPINSVCLERIAAIRTENHGASAGPEDPDHFVDREAVILYVLDHFMTEDQVECSGRKRERFPHGVYDLRRASSGFGGAFKVIFQSDNLAAERREVFDVHSHTTTVFQEAPLDAFACRAEDHIQPALLSCPPNIGWFSA